MSDEEKPVSKRALRLAEFTWEKFVAHADRNGGLNPCENCGASDWTASVGENGKADMLAPPMFMADSFYLILPVTCGKCGNMRMFNVGMIASIDEGDSDA